MTTISIENIKKSFMGRLVLRDVSASASSGDVLGVFGTNGSGKSTLMRIIAGVLRPDSGSVRMTHNGFDVDISNRPFHCGYVAPYLQIYDEFTPRELVLMHAKLHDKRVSVEAAMNVLSRVGIEQRADDIVRTFSSGMRQRVAIALAVCLEPPLLILDEPSTTLDVDGRQILAREVEAHQHRGGIVLLATNDERERELCTHSINVSHSASQVSAL
ncbi:MAG: ABC transporter ATP-binding protein [Candidatus Kapabacteria bacterium]|nr:ABC transporter ATP-binding protein [Candidatus Kapabacteria bacterium]